MMMKRTCMKEQPNYEPILKMDTWMVPLIGISMAIQIG